MRRCEKALDLHAADGEDLVLELERRDLLAAAVDDLLEAADELHVTLRIDAPFVARAQHLSHRRARP